MMYPGGGTAAATGEGGLLLLLELLGPLVASPREEWQSLLLLFLVLETQPPWQGLPSLAAETLPLLVITMAPSDTTSLISKPPNFSLNCSIDRLQVAMRASTQLSLHIQLVALPSTSSLGSR